MMQQTPITLQLGLSIESFSSIQTQMDILQSILNAGRPSEGEMGEFTRKMLENFYIYATSFARQIPQEPIMFGAPTPPITVIPVDVLDKWYHNFERKLKNVPNFWKELFKY